jgi:hypothetical protein
MKSILGGGGKKLRANIWWRNYVLWNRCRGRNMTGDISIHEYFNLFTKIIVSFQEFLADDMVSVRGTQNICCEHRNLMQWLRIVLSGRL